MSFKKHIYRSITPLFLNKNFKTRDRTLLISIDGIGDFLLLTGVLNLYKSFYENFYIVINKPIKELACLYLQADRILEIDKSKYDTDFTYRIQWLNTLRDYGFTRLISSICRSSIADNIAKFSGIPERIAYNGELLRGKSRNSRMYTKTVTSLDNQYAAKKYHHVLDHGLHMLNNVTGMAFTIEQAVPYIPVLNTGDDYCVWLPKSGNKETGKKRSYPEDTMVRIILDSIPMKMKCIILADRCGLWSTSKSRRLVDLSGKTTLSEAIGIIGNARLVVGNETGLAHAAWIMDRPTVMIYGGGHYGRFLPLKSCKPIMSTNTDCFCCDWRCKYNQDRFPCITSIEPETISAAIRELFKS